MLTPERRAHRRAVRKEAKLRAELAYAAALRMSGDPRLHSSASEFCIGVAVGSRTGVERKKTAHPVCHQGFVRPFVVDPVTSVPLVQSREDFVGLRR